MTMKAYCERSGRIGFTDTSIPSGALPILIKPHEELRETVEGTARHGYDMENGKRVKGSHYLLVPGVPEAENDDEAYNALIAYQNWVNKGIQS